jgi:hypothetical protein
MKAPKGMQENTSNMTESSREFIWRKSAQGFTLHLGRGRALLDVVPDGTYAGVWRIQMPDGRRSDMANLTWAKDAAISIASDGRRSDMANLTWAKDAAISIALTTYNRQRHMPETPAEAPPVALAGSTATSQPKAAHL